MKLDLEIVTNLNKYKPKLHYHSVIWTFLEKNKVKYHIDGVCRGG